MATKIAVVSATRAEYGLLKPLIGRIIADKDLELDLIITGAHLSDKQGNTIKEVQSDGFCINHIIPILEAGNSPYDISLTMANALKGFAQCFKEDRPDMVVILGDRTEMLAVAAAAMNERIPISHIHGGEVTKGAVDDCVRHALSKLSYLHFTSTEEYRKRVIQLGEDPKRVFNVGALGAENILNVDLFTETEIRNDIGIPVNAKYAVVTYHPVTLDDASPFGQVEEFLSAIDTRNDLFYVITGANADAGGDIINDMFKKYSYSQRNVIFEKSLGMKRYLSAVKYASMVIGNSSSGIIEAPVLGTPTVNIGSRQDGRLMADTIINCDTYSKDIINSIEHAENMPHKKSLMYGSGDTSKKIVETIKNFFMEEKIDLKKGFYDC